MVIFDLLDGGVVEEEAVMEPLEITTGFDLAMEMAVGGGLTPVVGGLTPAEVATLLGDGSEFILEDLSIVYNNGHRGWWFALQVGTHKRGSTMCTHVYGR